MIDFLIGVPGKLKAISDYLTANLSAARTALLDVAVSSRAPASTALSTATWSTTKAGYIDASISSRAASSPLLLAPMLVNFGSGSATKSASGYLTALSITGSGVINAVGGINYSGSGTGSIRVTIDGVTQLVKSFSTTHKAIIGLSNGVQIIGLDQIPFKTSLLIEVQGDVSTIGMVDWVVRRTT